MNNNQLPFDVNFFSENNFSVPIFIHNNLNQILERHVEKIYKTLSKTGYFSHDNSGVIVDSFYKEIGQLGESSEQDRLQIIAMTILMDKLLQKANDYNTYHFRQNRFLAFFNELFHYAHPALKREVAKADSFYNQFSIFLFNQIEQVNPGSPYEKLIATWLLSEENASKLTKHAEKLTEIQDNANLFLTKLSSLLYLQANDGAHSLSLLKGLQTPIHHSELIDHFLIMEQKQDYVMMKHWFDLFFLFEKPKQGTVLGKLYEDMLIETGTSEEKIAIVWNNWLNQPNFKTYKSRVSKSTEIEKQKALQFILPKLKRELYRPQTEATYYQIITEENLFEEGIHSLLTSNKDVTIMSPEIEKLLTKINMKHPELLLPFYHQLVERLVQKKSRVHYEEATYFIKRLKPIYEKINMPQTFDTYLKGLKKRFKTFRAFIQELNNIDH